MKWREVAQQNKWSGEILKGYYMKKEYYKKKHFELASTTLIGVKRFRFFAWGNFHLCGGWSFGRCWIFKDPYLVC